jgi:hypothetical protein
MPTFRIAGFGANILIFAPVLKERRVAPAQLTATITPPLG